MQNGKGKDAKQKSKTDVRQSRFYVLICHFDFQYLIFDFV